MKTMLEGSRVEGVCSIAVETATVISTQAQRPNHAGRRTGPPGTPRSTSASGGTRSRAGAPRTGTAPDRRRCITHTATTGALRRRTSGSAQGHAEHVGHHDRATAVPVDHVQARLDLSPDEGDRSERGVEDPGPTAVHPHGELHDRRPASRSGNGGAGRGRRDLLPRRTRSWSPPSRVAPLVSTSRRAAPTWSTIRLTAWATTSCISAAIRVRSPRQRRFLACASLLGELDQGSRRARAPARPAGGSPARRPTRPRTPRGRRRARRASAARDVHGFEREQQQRHRPRAAARQPVVGAGHREDHQEQRQEATPEQVVVRHHDTGQRQGGHHQQQPEPGRAYVAGHRGSTTRTTRGAFSATEPARCRRPTAGRSRTRSKTANATATSESIRRVRRTRSG